MIVYRKGDVLNDRANLTIIAHQTNCHGAMGAGIAKQIAELYPEVDQAQKEMYKAGKQKLGAIQRISVEGGKLTIVNLYEQKGTRLFPGQKLTGYKALEQCLCRLKAMMKETDVLGMPKIGAGRGGGDWSRISQIIENVFGQTTVYIYVLENKDKGGLSSIKPLRWFQSFFI